MKKVRSFITRIRGSRRRGEQPEITPGFEDKYPPDDPEYEPPLDGLCRLCADIVQKTDAYNQDEKPVQRMKGQRKSKHGSIRIVEEYPHHSSKRDLWLSARHCHLCSLLYIQCFHPPIEPLIVRVTFGFGGDYFADRLAWGVVPASEDPGMASLELTAVDLEYKLKHRDDPGSWRTSSTRSEATLATARSWIKTCLSQHSLCSRQGIVPTESPHRLLILSRAKDKIRMYLDDRIRDSAPVSYLTLSYCWGTTPFLTLLTTNYDSFKKEVPLDILPQTFKDAADITLRLGYHALWIDAFCIIQDDPEDWKQQAPLMGYIYGNSECTIAAMKGDDCFAGCYVDRLPLVEQVCKIRTGKGNHFCLESPYASLGGGYSELTDPSRLRAHLLTRGWVFQESLLCARTLYFSPQGIYWECCVVGQSEKDGHLFGSMRTHNTKADFTNLLNAKISNGVYAHESWYDSWWKLLERYTECDLTKWSDRWPALSGVAALLRNRNGGNILSGLWEVELMRELLWESRYPVEEHHLPHQPTWSWVSKKNPVHMSGFVYGNFSSSDVPIFTAKILSTHTDPREDDDRADVSITVQAPMLHCHLRELPEGEKGHAPMGHFAHLVSGPLHEQVRKTVENRDWIPDLSNIDAKREVWALQWLKGDHRLTALIVRPTEEDPQKWERIGIYDASYHGQVMTGDSIGEMKTICLI